MNAFRAAAAAISFLLPMVAAAVPAQVREQPIDEVAADLAYGFCPLYLAGQFSLTGPELAERGFGKTVLKQPHPRVGEMSLVRAKRPDGEIAFGGAAGKACTVIVTSRSRAAVLARLKANMSFMGLDFKPAPNPGPSVSVPDATIETFKAPAEAQFLYVQLIQMGGPAGTGPIAAQLFVTER